eukprot:scaffold146427_cov33-Tisochrysis_lutea.AAC.2
MVADCRVAGSLYSCHGRVCAPALQLTTSSLIFAPKCECETVSPFAWHDLMYLSTRTEDDDSATYRLDIHPRCFVVVWVEA